MNGVLVGKPFGGARFLKVPVSFGARSCIFKVTEKLSAQQGASKPPNKSGHFVLTTDTFTVSLLKLLKP